MDGHIHHQNLMKAKRDIAWLNQQLEERNLKAEDIIYAGLDSGGSFEVRTYEEANKS